MDREDRRRYFIVGSVILEIVQPLFRTRLENEYSSKGIGSLQDFLNSLPVLHTLFHLRHRNAYCCKDKINCRNNLKLPLTYCQWKLLYTENSGKSRHNCHCKITANPVLLNELDITLASLILLNCCNLRTSEENAVRKLLRNKNDYLSHNTEGKINETEYKSLWTDLINCVLQLDPNKQDDLIRIEKISLDEGLCSRYCADLLNIHKKLNEFLQIDTHIQGITSVMQMMGPQNHGITSDMKMMGPQIQGNTSDIQEILRYHRNEVICQHSQNFFTEQGMDERKLNSYNLGQNIFYLHHQTSLHELNSVVNACYIPEGQISDLVLTDDGSLVMCLFDQCSLVICNTDGSQVAIIPVGGTPYCVTAVTNSTVATIIYRSFNNPQIEMYDINSLIKLNSSQLQTVVRNCDITMINDKLVVCANKALLIFDYQTENVIQKIETHCQPWGIHASGHKIFYREHMSDKNNLYWYSFADDKIHTLTFPSIPCSMTTLHDGSLYVLCTDETVQHVSSDGIHFKTLKRSQFFNEYGWIRYNSKQKKMVTLSVKTGNVKIFHEI